MSRRKVFIIIDANSVVHRAFHALPSFTNKDGQAVGAVYGFTLAFFKAIKDFQPDYVVACFDTKEKNYRHSEFKDYKATRAATPKDLIAQFPKVKELLGGFGVCKLECAGYEADDLIATAATAALSGPGGDGIDIYVLTGDYDSLQLVDGTVRAYIINRGVKNAVLYDRVAVKEKFGVDPGQIVALKALAGDASDNIPGALGIGKKTAAELINRFGSLENIYRELDRDPAEFKLGSAPRTKKIRDILLANRKNVFLFQRLVTLDRAAPVDINLDGCRFAGLSGERPRQALRSFGFVSLVDRIPGGAAATGTLF